MAENLTINRVGEGLPIVLIHGWGLNSGVWQPLIEQLKSQYECISIDLPGFGVNAKHPLASYNLADLASIIVNQIAQPAVFVGWSLGGLIATQIALNYPQQLLGLVTVTSSPCFVEKPQWPGIKPLVLKGFHNQLAKDGQKTIANFMKIQSMGSPHIRHDVKLLQQLVLQYPQPSVATLNATLTLLETSDLRAQLAQINQPTLRLYGKLDSLVPKAAIEPIAKLQPQATHYVFEKASHAPFISHQQEFIQTLTSWLANCVHTD